MIYKGQTELSIRVNTGIDITGATAVLLKYKDPNGLEGSFTATIYNSYDGIINYDIVSSLDLNVVGKWTFWSHITFANAKLAPGKPFTLEVFKEGAIC